MRLLREITTASGLAGPLLGIDQRKLTDERLLEIGQDYRIIHFEMEG